MPDVLLTETTQILSVAEEVTQILSVAEEVTQILSVAEQGPPGPPGPAGPSGATTFVRQSAGALSAMRIVWEDEAGVVFALDSADEDHIDLLCGLTLTATSDAGQVTVQRTGAVDDLAWNWTPGRVYLGADGALTQSPPSTGFDVLVGVAVSPTRLILNFQDPIELE